jgi:hypothetical protein
MLVRTHTVHLHAPGAAPRSCARAAAGVRVRRNLAARQQARHVRAVHRQQQRAAVRVQHARDCGQVTRHVSLAVAGDEAVQAALVQQHVHGRVRHALQLTRVARPEAKARVCPRARRLRRQERHRGRREVHAVQRAPGVRRRGGEREQQRAGADADVEARERGPPAVAPHARCDSLHRKRQPLLRAVPL